MVTSENILTTGKHDQLIYYMLSVHMQNGKANNVRVIYCPDIVHSSSSSI